MRFKYIILGSLIILLVSSFGLQQESIWRMPEVQYPEDNPDSDASVELGGMLFFESLLSKDSTLSCQSCHLLTEAFADHLPVGLGIENRAVTRNTPTIFNIGLHPYLMKDGKFATLEEQVLGPINDHREFDMTPEEVVNRLSKWPIYNEQSRLAYGTDITIEVVQKALANFQRAVVSKNSPFDQFMQGDKSAIGDSAKRGWELFQSDRLNCTACHGGFDFTDYSFKNNGLLETYADSGRAMITHEEKDFGLFKVPTLRNVALTYPYLHNGSVETLRGVIDRYADGTSHGLQSSEIRQFTLSEQEKDDLEAFLWSLTEQRLLDNQ